MCGFSSIVSYALIGLLCAGIVSLGLHVKDVVKAGIAWLKTKFHKA